MYLEQPLVRVGLPGVRRVRWPQQPGAQEQDQQGHVGRDQEQPPHGAVGCVLLVLRASTSLLASFRRMQTRRKSKIPASTCLSVAVVRVRRVGWSVRPNDAMQCSPEGRHQATETGAMNWLLTTPLPTAQQEGGLSERGGASAFAYKQHSPLQPQPPTIELSGR